MPVQSSTSSSPANGVCTVCSTPLKRSQRRYCSMACRHAPSQGRPDTRRGGMVELICDACGKPIVQPASQSKVTRHHFCNPRCKGDWQQAHLRGATNPAYSGSSVSVPCRHCGKPVSRTRSQRQRNGCCFCSRTCYGAWRSATFVADRSPSWRGGRPNYRGPNWHRRSKQARERDGHRCRICSATSALHVHHVIPFYRFGYRPGVNKNHLLANAMDNLVTLCATCHRLVEVGTLALTGVRDH